MIYPFLTTYKRVTGNVALRPPEATQAFRDRRTYFPSLTNFPPLPPCSVYSSHCPVLEATTLTPASVPCLCGIPFPWLVSVEPLSGGDGNVTTNSPSAEDFAQPWPVLSAGSLQPSAPNKGCPWLWSGHPCPRSCPSQGSLYASTD